MWSPTCLNMSSPVCTVVRLLWVINASRGNIFITEKELLYIMKTALLIITSRCKQLCNGYNTILWNHLNIIEVFQAIWVKEVTAQLPSLLFLSKIYSTFNPLLISVPLHGEMVCTQWPCRKPHLLNSSHSRHEGGWIQSQIHYFNWFPTSASFQTRMPTTTSPKRFILHCLNFNPATKPDYRQQQRDR